MNKYAIRFRQVVLIGVLVNLFFALPGIIIPNSVLSLVGGEPVIHTLWPAFASLLLVLLSLFYIPVALDPLRYTLFAWLTVLAPVGGAIFFLFLRPGEYPLFGCIYLVFAVLEGLLLILALRAGPNIS